MNYFATIELKGGLGNQLFQICTILAYAWKCHYKVALPLSLSQASFDTQRQPYWDSIFLDFSKRIIKDGGSFYNIGSDMKYYIHRENMVGGFKEIKCQKHLNVSLIGYFQSYKYFENSSTIIFDYFNIRHMKKKIWLEKKNLFSKHTISLHFRQGDYKKALHYHYILPIEYYIEALKYLVRETRSSLRVLIFKEKQDTNNIKNNISILKSTFPLIEFVEVDVNLPDWVQMLLMSLCKDNIIANSSFSWFGAFFNKNKGARILYPSQWLSASQLENTPNEMCPPHWVQIDAKSQPLLKEVIN